jgi:hypothetical protein
MRLSNTRFPALLLSSFLFFVSSATLFAQEYTDALHTGANEYQIWSGYGLPQNPTWLGLTKDQPLSLSGFQYARVILASKAVAWKYTIEAIPLAFTPTQKPGGTLTCFPTTRSGSICLSSVVRKTSYGGGVNPFGMQLNFRRTRRLQPIVTSTGGFLYFSDPVPVIEASNFNFAFTVGTGVQWFITPSHSITFGYKFIHFSNHNLADANPGTDSHFLYAGFSFHR